MKATMKSLVTLLGLTNDVRKEYVDTRREEETLRRERDMIAAAPRARADVAAAVAAWVDTRGAAHAAGIEGQLRSTILGSTVANRPMRLPEAFTVVGALATSDTLSAADLDAALCALAGPELKRVLLDLVEKAQWPAAEGLPAAQRAQRIAALDERIAALAAQADEIQRQAEEAGIRL